MRFLLLIIVPFLACSPTNVPCDKREGQACDSAVCGAPPVRDAISSIVKCQRDVVGRCTWIIPSSVDRSSCPSEVCTMSTGTFRPGEHFPDANGCNACECSLR